MVDKVVNFIDKFLEILIDLEKKHKKHDFHKNDLFKEKIGLKFSFTLPQKLK